jgi:hypothetical protein
VEALIRRNGKVACASRRATNTSVDEPRAIKIYQNAITMPAPIGDSTPVAPQASGFKNHHKLTTVVIEHHIHNYT